MIRRLASSILAAFTVIQPAAAQAPADPVEALQRHGLMGAELGFLLFDLESGEALAAHNEEAPFQPASVAKLPTALVALEVLGAEHRFLTGLFATGAVTGGRVGGDLILAGGGNPFLSADDLAELAAELASSGVTEVSGRFLYDESLLAMTPMIDPAQPIAVTYNAGVSALSVNFNRVLLNWRRDGAALSASVSAVTDRMSIPVSHIAVGNAPAGTPVETPFLPLAAREGWMLAPGLPAAGEIWLPVRDPGLYAAHLFQDLAGAVGLALEAPARGLTPAGATALAVHRSLPLAEIVGGVLRYSNNPSAELIGLAASRQLTGEALPLARSAAIHAAWLAARIPDQDWDGYRLSNHSGLSTVSRASPLQIGAVLALAARERADLLALLPEITLGGPEDPAVSLRGKTGTMYYARGLAGVLEARSGRRLGFALFIGDPAARARLDAAADPARRAPAAGAAQWLEQARRLEREIVAGWAVAY